MPRRGRSGFPEISTPAADLLDRLLHLGRDDAAIAHIQRQVLRADAQHVNAGGEDLVQIADALPAFDHADDHYILVDVVEKLLGRQEAELGGSGGVAKAAVSDRRVLHLADRVERLFLRVDVGEDDAHHAGLNDLQDQSVLMARDTDDRYRACDLNGADLVFDGFDVMYEVLALDEHIVQPAVCSLCGVPVDKDTYRGEVQIGIRRDLVCVRSEQ